MSDEKKTSDQVEDSELNDLLDNALEDFSKGILKSEPKKENVPSTSSTATVAVDEPVETASTDDQWTKDFIKQATDQFEKNLQNLMQNGTDSELGASFQKMAQTVASAITKGDGTDEDDSSVDFQTAITQALKDLSVTSENLQSRGMGLKEADLAAMLDQASMEEGASDILPFMQGMMQTLLSKEVLYPSLKELIEKYPSWLEEKKSTLAPTDLERYTKQLDYMQKVCVELDKEKEDDTEDTKKQRFETILMLMQELQNCGQPPEDLVGDQPTLFQFDAEGNPIIPSLPAGAGADLSQNCCVM